VGLLIDYPHLITTQGSDASDANITFPETSLMKEVSTDTLLKNDISVTSVTIASVHEGIGNNENAEPDAIWLDDPDPDPFPNNSVSTNPNEVSP